MDKALDYFLEIAAFLTLLALFKFVVQKVMELATEVLA